jgi:hypothetical protein
MGCNFKHENIDVLFGVDPTPIEDLPKVCTCGAAITYAAEVAFVSAADWAQVAQVLSTPPFESKAGDYAELVDENDENGMVVIRRGDGAPVCWVPRDVWDASREG